MAYAKARHIDASQIPVIDMAPLLETDGHEPSDPGLERIGQALLDAAQSLGFFYVTNHGVDPQLIRDAQAQAKAFFAGSDAQKSSVVISPHHRGWLRQGEAQMAGNRLPDLKESFIWGLDIDADDPDYLAGGRLLAPNQWPEFVPQMRATLCAYSNALQHCGERLLHAFAASLSIAPDYFTAHMDKPLTRSSIVYYPPQAAQLGEDQFGVGPHTDYGTLTLVYQDNTGGLQVQGRDGEWLTAHPIEDTFVVNVGDLLSRWTNKRFQSTPHRVINASGRERHSMAVFVDPNWDAVIEPVVEEGDDAHYQPVRTADYITDRYNEAFRYRQQQ